MLLLLVLTGLLSAVLCALLIKHGRRIARGYGLDMPQRFHAGHVPRLGGVAIMGACTVGWMWMVVGEKWFNVTNSFSVPATSALAWWLVCVVPAIAGVAEDITHRLSPRLRLLMTVGAGFLAVWLLDLKILSLGLYPLDGWLMTHAWLAAALAAFAVGGLPHAFNLIDGYNGLASTVAIICCFAIAYVALQVGDRELAAFVLALAGGTAGFLVWNYPRGLIFAGDGGAYLWGVVIAVSAIRLCQRHPVVSPWFPMLLLMYPVWETVFSVYRKLVRGQSPGLADALHFHQLIYRRIVRGVFADDEAGRMLMRNNRTSPYLWGFTLFTVIPAVLFWQNTPMLMTFSALFVVAYVYSYTSIVRFKVPRWLRR